MVMIYASILLIIPNQPEVSASTLNSHYLPVLSSMPQLNCSMTQYGSASLEFTINIYLLAVFIEVEVQIKQSHLIALYTR